MNADIIFKCLRDPRYRPDPELVEEGYFLLVETVERSRSDETPSIIDLTLPQSPLILYWQGGEMRNNAHYQENQHYLKSPHNTLLKKRKKFQKSTPRPLLFHHNRRRQQFLARDGAAR